MSRKMATIRLCLLTFLGLSSVPIFLSSTNAAAQNAFCGLLSGDARRICQTAATLSREAREREPKSTREVQQPANETSNPRSVSTKNSAQPTPIRNQDTAVTVGAEEGTQHSVIDNLISVPIQGTYPSGYKPAWRSVTNNYTTVTFNTEESDPQKGGGSQPRVRQIQRGLGLVSDDGRLIIALDYGILGQQCYADVIGIGRVIGRQSQQFSLRNFRIGKVRDGSRDTVGAPCLDRGYVSADYSGQGSLRSDANGDLFLTLEIAVRRQARYSQWNSRARLQEYRIENSVTPQMVFADIQRKADIAASQLAQKKQQEDQARAQAAAIAALPRATAILSRQLATLVTEDSKGWQYNRLDAGTLTNVRIASGSVRSGTYALRGEYRYNNGSDGWVLASYKQGRFDCVEFSDVRGTCRSILPPKALAVNGQDVDNDDAHRYSIRAREARAFAIEVANARPNEKLMQMILNCERDGSNVRSSSCQEYKRDGEFYDKKGFYSLRSLQVMQRLCDDSSGGQISWCFKRNDILRARNPLTEAQLAEEAREDSEQRARLERARAECRAEEASYEPSLLGPKIC